MMHGFERVDGLAADAPRRAIGSDQLWVGGLQLLQFLKEQIELLVGDFGPILDVIKVVMAVDESAEFDGALRGFRHGTPKLGRWIFLLHWWNCHVARRFLQAP